MALQKQALSIPFSGSLDNKTDPWQQEPGKMLSMENIVFDKDKMYTKREGFLTIKSLPIPLPQVFFGPKYQNNFDTLATFKGNLFIFGSTVISYDGPSSLYFPHTVTSPLQLSVVPAIRGAGSVSDCDAAVASNGLAAVVAKYDDGVFRAKIMEYATQNQIGNSITFPIAPSTTGSVKTYVLGNYFVFLYLVTIAGTPRLRYVALGTNYNGSTSTGGEISTQVQSITTGYDAFVVNDTLYIAWYGNDLGGVTRVSYLTSTLTQGPTVVLSSMPGDRVSVTADTVGSTPRIWVSAWDSISGDIKSAALSSQLVTILVPFIVQAATTITQLTSTADSGGVAVIYQVTRTYSYSSTRTDAIFYHNLTFAGSPGTEFAYLYGVGLAARAFTHRDQIYVLAVYQSNFQNTYFLGNPFGRVAAKVAYSNGGGYITGPALPNASILEDDIYIGYLFKATVLPLNKATSTGGVYAQLGANIMRLDMDPGVLPTAEVGENLHIAGGIVNTWDGAVLCEQGFNLWPEDGAAVATTGGSMSLQDYRYIQVYEWTDHQGNIHRSAPSLPIAVTVAGVDNAVTVHFPHLRLTSKQSTTANSLNSVRLVIYRWSTAQQNYYQVTSVTSPIFNTTIGDSTSYLDTQTDAQILGNNLLYTTGGVIENIGAPPAKSLTLYKNRLWAIDAENKNRLWYSKPVLDETPVEMSDLFTQFIAPTAGAQGSTGDMEVIAPMDDKLIIGKKDALYYMVGSGPDITGANNDFSDPIFITSTVGCSTQQSIVFIPSGLLFKSDKGYWLLQRDLGTNYIGSRVEDFNSLEVRAALAIPGTNEARILLEDGTILMYDYLFDRWGTFTGVPGNLATLYNGKHTQLEVTSTNFKLVQQTDGVYADDGRPVLMRFTTGWFNLMGLQGFQRAYEMYLLGRYRSPHKLTVSVAYDYNDSYTQSSQITPINFSANYGDTSPYGADLVYGGNLTGDVEQWKVFFTRQKCQAFKLKIEEIFDVSMDTAPGEGLTLSGINLVMGAKKQYKPQPAAVSVG